MLCHDFNIADAKAISSTIAYYHQLNIRSEMAWERNVVIYYLYIVTLKKQFGSRGNAFRICPTIITNLI